VLKVKISLPRVDFVVQPTVEPYVQMVNAAVNGDFVGLTYPITVLLVAKAVMEHAIPLP
jgi:uncharacterized protein (DUF427 family)